MTRQSRKTRERGKPQPVTTTGDAVRTIKKYPNRRLYDTGASRYVTVADLRDLIRAQEPFLVQDAKTGANLTRGVLLQILLELEASAAPMFSNPVLSDLIRLYSHPHQERLRVGLERNIGAIAQSAAEASTDDEASGIAGSCDLAPRSRAHGEHAPLLAPADGNGSAAAVQARIPPGVVI